MKDVYAVLEAIKDIGLINVNFEVYCFSCNKFTGLAFETIGQLPEYIQCEECFRELNPIEDNIVVYKVIIDE
jgi:hypothetical protein